MFCTELHSGARPALKLAVLSCDAFLSSDAISIRRKELENLCCICQAPKHLVGEHERQEDDRRY